MSTNRRQIERSVAGATRAILAEKDDEVGAGAEQPSTQHSRAVDADPDCCWRAPSQHFIISGLSACSGIPPSTPVANANEAKNAITQFFNSFGTIYILKSLTMIW